MDAIRSLLISFAFTMFFAKISVFFILSSMRYSALRIITILFWSILASSSAFLRASLKTLTILDCEDEPILPINGCSLTLAVWIEHHSVWLINWHKVVNWVAILHELSLVSVSTLFSVIWSSFFLESDSVWLLRWLMALKLWRAASVLTLINWHLVA